MPGHVSAGDQVGVATEHIDRLMFEFAIEYGAMPATLMYRGYAKSTCSENGDLDGDLIEEPVQSIESSSMICCITSLSNDRRQPCPAPEMH